MEMDEEAIALISTPLKKLVSKLLRGHKGIKLDAMDFVSQVLLEVATKKLPDTLSRPPLAYLHGVAKHKISEQYRKFGKEIPVDFNSGKNLYAEMEIQKEEDPILIRVETLLQFLPESCQQLLRAFFSTSNVTEIADQLGYKNIDSIYTRKNQCLNKLDLIIREKDQWLAKKLRKNNNRKKNDS